MMAMMAMRFQQTRMAAPPSVEEGGVQSLFLYSSLFSSSEHCVAFLEHLNFVQVSLPVISIGWSLSLLWQQKRGVFLWKVCGQLQVGLFFLWGQTLETEGFIRNTRGTFELKTAPITPKLCQKLCEAQFPHCISEPVDRPYKCLKSMEPRRSETYNSL